MPSVLVIDDHYEALTEIIQAAVAQVRGVDVRPVFARDFGAARTFLDDPGQDVQLVLLDQLFDDPRCTLVDREGKVLDLPRRDAQQNQGLWIAQLIYTQFRGLRPAVRIFTQHGREFIEGNELRRQGILDGYQAKPGSSSDDDRDFERLVENLRWHLCPGEAVLRSKNLAFESIDPRFDEFLTEMARCWRRDTAAIFEALASLARRHNHGRLDDRVWNHAFSRPDILPDLHAAWTDEEFWSHLLRSRFGGGGGWKAGHEEGESLTSSRFRVFSRDESGDRLVLLILDPARLPMLDPTRWRLLEEGNVIPELDRIPGETAAGRAPGLFRWTLSPRAPGGPFPWLIGSWFLAKGGEFTSLAEQRRRRLDQPDALRAELQRIVGAIDHGPTGLLRKPVEPGWGLLADAVLIPRTGVPVPSQRSAGIERAPSPTVSEGIGPLGQWVAPLLPIETLRLHPDPEVSPSLSRSRVAFQESATIGGWLQALAVWFGTNRLPDPTQADLADRYQRVQRISRGEQVPLRIRGWWREKTKGTVRELRDQLVYRGATLVFEQRTRCLRGDGRLSYVVHQGVQLVDCTLVCQHLGDSVLTLFEQIAFRNPVVLENCTLIDEHGQSAPLRVHDCVFQAGLILSGVRASAIEIESCELTARQLRIQGVELTTDLVLRKLTARHPVQVVINDSRARRITMTDCRLAHLELKGGVRAEGAMRLEVNRPDSEAAHVKLRGVSSGGFVNITPGPGVVVLAQRLRCGSAFLDLQAADAPVRLEAFRCRESMVLKGPKQPASPPVPVEIAPSGQERQSRIERERNSQSRIEQSLLGEGNLSLNVDQLRIGQDLRLQGTMQQVLLSHLVVEGSVEVAGVTVAGEFRLDRGRIEGSFNAQQARFRTFTMAGATCMGSLLFQRSEFQGPVRIGRHGGWVDSAGEDGPALPSAPRGRSSAGPTEPRSQPASAEGATPDLAAVMFRDRIDFSHARFGATADFSHTIIEHHAIFQDVEFHGKADFEAVQAGTNVTFNDAVFFSAARFSKAIVQGLFDGQNAEFHHGVDFRQASLQVVRLSGARWPELMHGHRSAADFRDCSCTALLDLSHPGFVRRRPETDLGSSPPGAMVDPEQFGAGKHESLATPSAASVSRTKPPVCWFDLEGATVERLVLEVPEMEQSLERAGCRSTNPDVFRLRRLARLFESTLAREMRFNEADEFYRRAHSYNLNHPRWARFLDWLWGHGTRPFLVFRSMAVVALLMVLLVALAALATNTAIGEIITQSIKASSHVLLGESPQSEALTSLGSPFVSAAIGLTFLEVILMNLFFAALARKLLR